MTTFAELGLSAPVLEALEHLGYQQPTPIQEETIPLLLEGRDVIGQAQTGTGKTAAFGLPMMEYIDPTGSEIQALVLTPTRELCIQVTQALRAYGERRGINVVAVFGGAPIREQASQLKNDAHVVVGTVGRVMDMIGRHYLFLDQVRYVVLDEADEMLDLGFFEDVEDILSRAPSGRQTALFSATIPPPIKKLAEKRMYDPVTIKVKAAQLTIDTVDQFHVEVNDKDKPDKLADVLKAERPEQAIIFARTKIGVDRLARRLGDKGLRVKTLHGDMTQGARDGVMIAFKGGREKLLVATDVAARGLDITGVSHVVNYDIPNSPDIYVHRIGRTGRAGESGRAITFITPKQHSDLEAIERHAKTEIPAWGSGNGDALVRRSRSERDAGPPPEAAAAPEALESLEPSAAPEAPVSPPSRGSDTPADEERPRRSRGRGRGGRGRGNRDPDRDAAPTATAAVAEEPDSEPEEKPQTRRPRHTKPRRDNGGKVKKLIVGAGRGQGLEPADVIGAIVDNTHLDGEDVRNVRVLERFTFVEVPADRAAEVVEKVTGNEVRGVALRLEVAKR
jgi:ATP-dependent RNA helicase DeaD